MNREETFKEKRHYRFWLGAVISRFLKRYLCFKPLYLIEKKIDPSCRSGKPKYKRFSRFVYKVAKWSL